ncbi:hypothetical protein HPB51_008106 [Rhipicephalus microplus]|uniref:RING-type E3 ubiquitin transferase n=1 Tax=Rhipicephalus microplus TaxID=6941 RepID=A0A9J6EMI8_RHIMP|nr:hypothetical protein HPB51_008106 [Rhipicephalus microplus]
MSEVQFEAVKNASTYKASSRFVDELDLSAANDVESSREADEGQSECDEVLCPLNASETARIAVEKLVQTSAVVVATLDLANEVKVITNTGESSGDHCEVVWELVASSQLEVLSQAIDLVTSHSLRAQRLGALASRDFPGDGGARHVTFGPAIRLGRRPCASGRSTSRNAPATITHAGPLPTSSTERRSLYELDLWVCPPNNRRSARHFSPAFFRENPACTHRLIPWLNRELVALLGSGEAQITFTTELVLALITRYEVCCLEFAEHVRPFFGTRTAHFLHELAAFVASPLDMVAYDRVAVYDTRANVVARGTPAAQFLQSPDSSSEDTTPLVNSLSPLRISARRDFSLPGPSGLHNTTVTLVETDSDDSDCMIVSTVGPAVPVPAVQIRPRTPIFIELSSSDEGDGRSGVPPTVAPPSAMAPSQPPATRKCRPVPRKKRLLQFWSSDSGTSTASDTDSDNAGVDRATQRLQRRMAMMRRKRARAPAAQSSAAVTAKAASGTSSLPTQPVAAAVQDQPSTSSSGHNLWLRSKRTFTVTWDENSTDEAD